jgi:predicted Rossmann-fold nucleotide-binding protein
MIATLEKNGNISPGDCDLFVITDDPQDVVKRILDYMRQVGPPEVTPRGLG